MATLTELISVKLFGKRSKHRKACVIWSRIISTLQKSHIKQYKRNSCPSPEDFYCVSKYHNLLKQTSVPILYENLCVKGFETRHLKQRNHVSFEAELRVDCSNGIQFAYLSFLLHQISFTMHLGHALNTTVCPSRRQSPYNIKVLYQKALIPCILPYWIIHRLEQNCM